MNKLNNSWHLKHCFLLSDRQLGCLVRRGVETWQDIAEFSLNEIYSIGGEFSETRFIRSLHEKSSENKIRFKKTDFWMLLDRSVRQKLLAAGIESAEHLSTLTVSEVRNILRSQRRVGECEDVLTMMGVSLKPQFVGFSPEQLKIKEGLLIVDDFRNKEFISGIAKDFEISEFSVKRRISVVRNLEKMLQQFEKDLEIWGQRLEAYKSRIALEVD